MRIQVTRFLRFSNCIEFDRSLKTKIHQNRHGQKSNQNAALEFDRAIKMTIDQNRHGQNQNETRRASLTVH